MCSLESCALTYFIFPCRLQQFKQSLGRSLRKELDMMRPEMFIFLTVQMVLVLPMLVVTSSCRLGDRLLLQLASLLVATLIGMSTMRIFSACEILQATKRCESNLTHFCYRVCIRQTCIWHIASVKITILGVIFWYITTNITKVYVFLSKYFLT